MPKSKRFVVGLRDNSLIVGTVGASISIPMRGRATETVIRGATLTKRDAKRVADNFIKQSSAQVRVYRLVEVNPETGEVKDE